MKGIKGKIMVSMVSTVVISLLLLGIVCGYLNYSSTNDTLEQTMKEMAIITADRVSQELTAYKNVATEAGCIEQLSDPLASLSQPVRNG